VSGKELSLAKVQVTPEEAADNDGRTTSLGLFNTAESYWQAARSLKRRRKPRGTHPHNPTRLLYYHALELYLKALIRQKYSVAAMRDKFGHRLKRLAEEAGRMGLSFDDEDEAVIALIDDTDAIIEARYIRTGPKTWADFGALDRTSKSLRASVGKLLKKAGVQIRLK
jgi:hypothetical protein